MVLNDCQKKKNYMVLWRIQWGIFLKKIQIDWIKIEHTVSKTKKYFFFWPTRYFATFNQKIFAKKIETLMLR